MLSLPFWLAGTLTNFQLLPGLPVSSLMLLCPATAALILVYRENQTVGVAALLKRSFDYQQITAQIWYAPILLLSPAVMVLSYAQMRMLGLPLPTPQFPTVSLVLLMCFAFFFAALAEELGWSGYVIDPLQERWNALPASIVVGLVWAVWHIIPLIQANRSLSWIVGQCLATVATRIVLVWLYNNTGRSVFAATLYHATSNVSWQLFPNRGSHYDPWVTGLIVALVAVIVTLGWGPRTLASRSPRV